ncbi:MAG: hypothetical protein K8S23_07395 [Candidatus Cloacimonetes bacterium]|nr:hypothetical protein [Candidatus Cloacimonadota bacterium]
MKNLIHEIEFEPKKKRICIYFKKNLSDVIHESKNSLTFKIILANLINSGLNQSDLSEIFDTPRTTISRWGKALMNDDVIKIIKAFSGAGSPRKITPEIENFIKYRLKKSFRYKKIKSLVSDIREEIEEIFGVLINIQKLKSVLNKIKKERINNSLNNDSYEEEDIIFIPKIKSQKVILSNKKNKIDKIYL